MRHVRQVNLLFFFSKRVKMEPRSQEVRPWGQG